MFDKTKLKVSKIEAAQRQLDCAIELWFLEKDAVSIHALAAAAYQIIHDIYQKKPGTRDLLYDSIVIKDEYRKEFINSLKAPVNFFKHADNDPGGVMEFNPASSFGFMFFSIMGLQLSGEKISDTANALLMWIMIHEPQWLTASGKKLISDHIPVEQLEKIRQAPKDQFFEALLPLLANAKKRK